MDCFNIGYQGKSLTGLCSVLIENEVRLLIDIREHAWSQRPEFRKQVLQNTLANHGINYLHFKSAGNPFRRKNGERIDFSDCAIKYAHHLEKMPEVVQTLEEVIKNERAAVFCYERERDHCHRSILLDTLIKRNPEIKIIDL